MLPLLLLLGLAPLPADPCYRIVIAAKPARTVIPATAVGMGLDGSDRGTTDRLLRPDTLRALRSLHLPNLTYRLRTELAIEAWHWNPTGTWSEPAHEQGYFTGAAIGTGAIRCGWGYRLPRRGNTVDQANNDGYSRLADNDERTFWKSNPYLDSHFTGDADGEHPQWIIIDLGHNCPVNAVRIAWAAPYATAFRVEYAVLPPAVHSGDFSATFAANARWAAFPSGVVANAHGNSAPLRLAPSPLSVRFVRISMTTSSHTAVSGTSGDVRDTLGYAVREIGVGTVDATNRFTDRVVHTPNGKKQTVIYTSSTDPWHNAAGKDSDTEQPGFDPFFAANENDHQPVLLPVGVAYDTPENAASLLRYVRRRGFPVTQIELGEEPDGQYLSPEDYGALYVQFAHALRRIDPAIQLGGPSFQTAIEGWIYWADERGDTSWMRRFLRYLNAHHAAATFNFFSFEWYPFDNLTPSPESLLRAHPALLDASLARLRQEGVPVTIPWLVSELGWSPFSAEAEVDVPGALLDAETVARFLTHCNGTAYFYGVQPGALEYEQGATPGVSWGGLFAFLADDEGTVKETLPTAWAARLLMESWFEGKALNRPHQLYETRVLRTDTGTDDGTIGAYTLRQPGGVWSVLLLNRSTKTTCHVALPGRHLLISQYGRAQYRWHRNGANGHPAYSRPPHRFPMEGKTITLPPMSLTVASWKP